MRSGINLGYLIKKKKILLSEEKTEKEKCNEVVVTRKQVCLIFKKNRLSRPFCNFVFYLLEKKYRRLKTSNINDDNN
jgi:hypothetical protein